MATIVKTNIPSERSGAVDEITSGLLQQATLTPEEQARTATEEENRKRLFDYTDAIIRLKALHQKWSGEEVETTRRRMLRNIDINPKQLRDSGKLRPDETIIPIRMVDTNIRREQPAYINYLKGSQRLSIFKCVDDVLLDCQNIESEFTAGMQYVGWETPHFKVLDGSQTHGWDSVEVVYDASKPLHVSIEQVGHENLFFGLESLKTDSCEILIRKYSFSQMQLKTSVTEFGFVEAQVNLLLDKTKGSPTEIDNNIPVFKILFKYKSPDSGKTCVYVAWYSDKDGCTDWLKQPTKLYLGRRKQVQVMVDVPVQIPQQIVPAGGGMTMVQPARVEMTQQPQLQWQDVDETEFPIFLLPYSETEQQTIISHKGRVFFDQYKQEAVTSIASGFTNALNRASNVYGSVANSDPGRTAAPKQLDTSLEHGKIYDTKIDFWGHNYPDPMTLNALQYFSVQNSEETGQTSFAVNNRQDSRKTAAEINTANQQQQLLSGVQVSLYSTFLRQVYSFVWLIVQSQALQDKIKFLQITKTIPDMMSPQGQRTIRVNNKDLIGLQYDVRAAGDIDVIQRAEMRQKMINDWPVLATTPIASEFLQEFVRLSYPSQADKWVAMLKAGDQTKQVVAKLADLLMTMTSPQDLVMLPPEAKQEIAVTLQAAQQIVTGQSQTTQQAPTQ